MFLATHTHANHTYKIADSLQLKKRWKIARKRALNSLGREDKAPWPSPSVGAVRLTILFSSVENPSEAKYYRKQNVFT